ncbi:MAG: heparinase II/III family protein [Candidatus Eisenbacteria bacterium]|nr:heparinase II/III family protein [Candidatus Eisenbacteria bacterium]
MRRNLSYAPLLLTTLTILLAVGAASAYNLPPNHPRVFFTGSEIDEIADRCKEGGTHRAFYEKLKQFADSRIGAGKTKSVYLPDYALVYKIHKQWNEEGYQGGGFDEETYWSFTRSALLSSANWGTGSYAAEYAMAVDWIWEKLSSSDVQAIAAKAGNPVTSVADGQTWRDNTTYYTLVYLFRSLAFAGSVVDGGAYTAEYQATCGYIEDYFAPALELMGGVGATGPGYETILQFDRSWTIEAFTAATGMDGWALTGKWAEEWGKWIVYSDVPHRGVLEPNQDTVTPVWSDKYKNVAIIAARARDPYNQDFTWDYWEDILGRSISDEKNCALWSLALWYDPTVPTYSPSTSPKAVRLGADGMDHVYMTTGLGDNDATWACFEAGLYLYGHQHQDAGAFTIHRKGDLALDSGFYGQYRSTAGGSHAINYYHRSTAHNTVSIYDPGEEFYWGASDPSNGPIANDGGQILPRSAPNLEEVLADSTFHPGKMLAFETNDSYTYCQADLHNAYNQEALAESRDIPFHPNKLSHITREFVFLRPDYFVVMDRVVSTDADFVKVWNLHVASDPSVLDGGSGTLRMGNAEAGIRDYPGASLVKVTDASDLYSRGSLFLKVLLPEQRTVRKIGGRNRDDDGFAYWIGGFDGNGRYDPTEGQNFYWGDWLSGHEYNEDYIERMTIGWGRIEVEATDPALSDVFLNVLYPCDESASSMPETRRIDTENMVGAEIVNERVILFGRESTDGIDSVSYHLSPEDTTGVHTVCNLDAGQTYRVFALDGTVWVRRSGMPAPDGAEEIVSPAPTATASGLVTFSYSGEAGDPVLVEITDLRAESVGTPEDFAVAIRWTTNVAADTRIEFGATAALGSWSALDPALVTEHEIVLSDPDARHDQDLYYRVHSAASGGASAAETGGPFHEDVLPPAIITWVE